MQVSSALSFSSPPILTLTLKMSPVLIDPAVWRASSPVAGVKIPVAGSSVFYIPQGHAEQTSSPLDLTGAAVSMSQHYYSCIVTAVRYLADPDTDEVFVRISLLPTPGMTGETPRLAEERPARSCSKVLTPSDANNGGGFSAPRFCAETVFPPLDFDNCPTPVQVLEVRDLLGNQWDFRHIYRGAPRRNLLTTGWSNFVNAKKLVAGDTVVFISHAGELFVGIRRRQCRRVLTIAAPEGGAGGGFVRNGRGRVAPASVVEAVRAAEEGRAFDVDFYPGKGTPEFVVDERSVARAVAAGPAAWAVGARVRIPVETDDTTTVVARLVGTVTGVAAQHGCLWPGSLWRMLQITWDDPNVLPDLRSVCPWQLELMPTTFRIDSLYPFAKKPRLPHCYDFIIHNQVEMSTSSRVDETTEGSTLSQVSYSKTFPVGMQGARQGQSCARSMYNRNYNHNLYMYNMYESSILRSTNLVADSTNLSIMTAESTSEPTHNNILQDFGTNNSNTTVLNSATDGSASFMLFGHIISCPLPDAHIEEVKQKEGKDAMQTRY